LEDVARGIAEEARQRMKAALIRVALIAAVIGVIEVLCLTGRIGRFSMQAPHKMLFDLWKLLASGKLNAAMVQTLGNAAIAFAAAFVLGVVAAVLLHGTKRARETLEPLFSTYYAIPVFAFYPLLIVIFGLGDLPQILTAFMLAVVTVIVNTLNGLDRVPRVYRKAARTQRLGMVHTAWRITLPFAWPYVLTGAKLAVGIIASEFLMGREGMGYEIAFAYNNFDNARMYPLIILVLGAAIVINGLLHHWERVLLARRGLK
jgi:NitT/TauT family transport system permease protein